MANYSIDTGDGNQLCAGLSPYEYARKVAQQRANERGEAVTLYDPALQNDEGTGPSETIEPGRKADVTRWETVASYVATFPSDGEEGACDVEVQIGEAQGVWFVRTSDDAGGSDDAPDTGYASRVEAANAAEAFAANAQEAEEGEDAGDYLRRQKEEQRGKEDPDGEWCSYWTSAIREDEGPRARYATEEQAVAAVAIANEELRARNPGSLLCAFEVRHLVDGEWVGIDAELSADD